jgi:proline iminopeptidase
VPELSARDGTTLAYHASGVGTPVICLPGGPMVDSAYLGDLGGLSARVRLIRLDLRGTGDSATPTDPGSYRCDRLVEDVEALREHLDLDQIVLLGHSAGANIAVGYLARYPERVARLVLVTPSVFGVGIEVTSDIRRELVELRSGEPWYPPAAAAFERVAAGEATDDDWAAITPFTHGRWDDAARAHEAGMERYRHPEAAAGFFADGAFDPPATRAALADFGGPVLLLAGEYDVAAAPKVMAEFAGLFRQATLVIQPGAGHSPWLDDPGAFTATVASFVD